MENEEILPSEGEERGSEISAGAPLAEEGPANATEEGPANATEEELASATEEGPASATEGESSSPSRQELESAKGAPATTPGPMAGDDATLSLFGGNEESEATPRNPLHAREFIAHEFLLWLWFHTEHEFGGFELSDGPIDLWFDDRMTFLAAEEKKVISTFNGGAPSTTPEAKLSILSGKVISETRLGLRRGDNEWSFVLRVKAGEIYVHGLKVPAVVKDLSEEMIYERIFLIELINRVLEVLFAQFFEIRTSDTWSSKTVPAMTSWLLGEDS